MVRHHVPSNHGSGTRNILNDNFIQLFNETKRYSTIRAEAELINKENVKVQKQLNKLVIESGNANAEVSQARGEYQLLNERLDSEYSEMQAIKSFVYVSEFDYVIPENDDTGRIRRAIKNCSYGDKLVAENLIDPYVISDTIYIDKKIDIDFWGDVVFKGTKSKPVFHIKNIEGCKFNFKIISDVGSYESYQSGYHGWNNQSYAAIVTENLRECYVNVVQLNNFTVGVHSLASSGKAHWFNHITALRMFNCRIGHLLETTGVGSWMNSNYYYDTSCGFSGSDFNGDTKEKFTVRQIITEGNEYGGNSNVFYRFKFEVGSNPPSNLTQVKLDKANGFQFIDYRFEQGTDTPFVVMDLSYQDTSKIYVTHSDNNVFKPAFVLGYGHEIKFINVGSPQTHYSGIAKIVSPDENDHEIYNVSDLKSKYRRAHDNQHLIKGVYRKALSSTSLTAEETFDYSAESLLVDNGVRITGPYPVVVYVENLTVGDEFEVFFHRAKSGVPATVKIKSFDSSGKNITTASGNNIIALRGATNNGVFSLYSINVKQRFTINHPDVHTIAILIDGTLDGFKITSNNKSNVVKKSMNADWNNTDELMFFTVPNRKSEGNFKIGEIVTNTNKTSGQPVGWQFMGTEWITLGLRH